MYQKANFEQQFHRLTEHKYFEYAVIMHSTLRLIFSSILINIIF